MTPDEYGPDARRPDEKKPDEHGPDEHGLERRALEALVVAALRKQDVDAMSFEKLQAFETDLSREDRAALVDLSPDLIAEVISRQEERGRAPIGRERSRHVNKANLNSKGAKVMKSLVLSILVVSGLAGAIVIGTTLDDHPSGFQDTALDGVAVARLSARLESIEKRLETLGQLESRLDSIAIAVSRSRSPVGGDTVRGDATTLVAGEESVARELNSEEGEALHDYIVQVMEEVRDEQIAAQRRRAEERNREFMALHEGPYGNHNFRVNSMAKRLDFSDDQRELYYVNLVEYTNLIQQSREQESQDKENRQRYRDQRKVLRTEFAQVIAASLPLEQAEVFTSLPEHEQRPDGSARYTTSIRMISNSGLPGETVSGTVSNTFIPVGAEILTTTGTGGALIIDKMVERQTVRAELEAETARKNLEKLQSDLEQLKVREKNAEKESN